MFSAYLLFCWQVTSPCGGKEDHLAKFGVNKLDEKINAPEFTLPDINGKKRSLSDFQGKFIMLNFWATW